MKKTLIIFLIFICLALTLNCKKKPEDPPKENEPEVIDPIIPDPPIVDPIIKEVGIEISQLPHKVNYNYDDRLNLDGLIVSLLYSDNSKKEITDYELFREKPVIGKNKIFIKYHGFTTYFYITYKEVIEHEIIPHKNYALKTYGNIPVSEFSFLIGDLYYAQPRKADTIIYFDHSHPVKTNIYGYEILLDKYGNVIDKATNVNLDEGHTVISAHGALCTKKLKEVELGDYIVICDNTAFVYRKNIMEENILFSTFYKAVDSVNEVKDIEEKNRLIDQINNFIPVLDSLYEKFDKDIAHNVCKGLEEFIKEKDNSAFYNNQHSYSYADINTSRLERLDSKLYPYVRIDDYQGLYSIGGFRNEDYITYYDKDHMYRRNTFGSEVAVSKDGYVIEKGTLVDLPEGGFILSGHGKGDAYLTKNIKLDDYIVPGKTGFSVDRSIITSRYNDTVDKYNRLMDYIDADILNKIPHDYVYIKKALDNIHNLDLFEMALSTDLASFYRLNASSLEFNQAINNIMSNLIDYNFLDTRGLWYIPFGGNYDDTSYEGVYETMSRLKAMGVNEVILDPFAKGYALFENSIYYTYDPLKNYDYKEYGNDFLKCFIEVAHKFGIKVNAFTQTTSYKPKTMINPKDDYYLMDYYGTTNYEGRTYLDLCNDEVKDLLLVWYKELVSQYNWDLIEYDIIRSQGHNLSSFKNDIISDKAIIYDYGYNPKTLDKFMKLYNYQGDFKENLKSSIEFRNNWMKFKEDEMLSFMDNCSNMIRTINPKIKLSAAVFANPTDAKINYLQDYKKMLDYGYIDYAEPMAYTFDNNDLVNLINNFKDERFSHIRIGLSPRLTEYDTFIDLEQIRIACHNNGYLLFSSCSYLGDSDLYMLLKGSQHYQAITSLNEEDLFNYNLDDMIDMIRNYYSIVNNEDYCTLTSALSKRDLDLSIKIINELKDSKMKSYLLNKLS